MANPVPIPTQDPFVKSRDWVTNPDPKLPDSEEGKLTKVAIEYLESQGTTLNSATTNYSPAQAVGQTASIGLTAINAGSLSSGLYRVSYYLAITTPAGTSSSITVSYSWTENALTKSHSFTAFTGNTNVSNDSNSWMVHIDGGSPISYSAVSVPVGTPPTYSLYVTLELLNR